jgi:hypothetical protein
VNIEVVRDPLELAIEDGLLMDERHEVLPDGEWIRAVRRVTERDDLFVYRHKQTGRFELCQWTHEGDVRVCREILGMDMAPDRGGWVPLRIVELQCRPTFIKAREMRARIAEERARASQAKADGLEQKGDIARHLRLRGKAAEAAMVTQGPYATDAESGESLDELRDDLTRAASTKVITHG